MGRDGSRYHRPEMVHEGPSSGFSLMMQMLVSSLMRTVGSKGIYMQGCPCHETCGPTCRPMRPVLRVSHLEKGPHVLRPHHGLELLGVDDSLDLGKKRSQSEYPFLANTLNASGQRNRTSAGAVQLSTGARSFAPQPSTFDGGFQRLPQSASTLWPVRRCRSHPESLLPLRQAEGRHP